MEVKIEIDGEMKAIRLHERTAKSGKAVLWHNRRIKVGDDVYMLNLSLVRFRRSVGAHRAQYQDCLTAADIDPETGRLRR